LAARSGSFTAGSSSSPRARAGCRELGGIHRGPRPSVPSGSSSRGLCGRRASRWSAACRIQAVGPRGPATPESGSGRRKFAQAFAGALHAHRARLETRLERSRSRRSAASPAAFAPLSCSPAASWDPVCAGTSAFMSALAGRVVLRREELDGRAARLEGEWSSRRIRPVPDAELKMARRPSGRGVSSTRLRRPSTG